jgi:putative Ca2+/H+ antiporter (TMEM165/GDT1 family)
LIWFKREEEEKSVEKRHYSSRAMFVSFAAIFFSEWGDAGQLISALLVTRYQAPVVVWLGATLALTTKGILAIALGVKLRRRVPKHILRPVSVAICLIMGVVSAVNLWI